jgi:ORF6N domain
MNDISVINEEIVKNKIYFIRGYQVMLDRDLAELYNVKPIKLREQVKRNIDRFPKDFMFQLDDNEVNFMVSQNAIPSKQHLGGSLPYVFTEQGVASTSSVLTNKIAINIHIKIMRAFVQMRKFISNNALVFQRLDSLEQKQFKTDEKVDAILDAIESKELQLDLKKHNAQYSKIELKKFDSAHDRFLILDDKDVYHIGASLKDLGKKWFAFSKFEMDALDSLMKLKEVVTSN